MAKQLPDSPARRTDPRVAQTRELVLAATFRLLAEQGLAGATVERVAEYSGVSRSTIYRHWPDPSRLYLQALTTPMQAAVPLPRTDDPRTDLRTYARHLAKRLNDPVFAAAFSAVMAEATRSPAWAAAQRRYVRERTQPAVLILRDAAAQGLIRPDLDLKAVVYEISSPLAYECFVLHRKISVARADEVVDRVYASIALPVVNVATDQLDVPADDLRRTG